MDRRTRRELERAIGALETDAGGPSRQYLDTIGPAIYQTEPVWRTVVACLRCFYLGLIITLPRKPELAWTCSQCGLVTLLRPPLPVLMVPEPAHPRLSTMGRPRLSTPPGERARHRLQ